VDDFGCEECFVEAALFAPFDDVELPVCGVWLVFDRVL
jgi:hypothetical protein